MGKPLSMDLRSLALAAVDEGTNCRAAARRFGVAAATVIRRHDQRRCTGGYAAKPQDEDTQLRRVEAHAYMILALDGARHDIALDELRRDLG
jgi:transposase